MAGVCIEIASKRHTTQISINQESVSKLPVSVMDKEWTTQNTKLKVIEESGDTELITGGTGLEFYLFGCNYD